MCRERPKSLRPPCDRYRPRGRRVSSRLNKYFYMVVILYGFGSRRVSVTVAGGQQAACRSEPGGRRAPGPGPGPGPLPGPGVAAARRPLPGATDRAPHGAVTRLSRRATCHSAFSVFQKCFFGDPVISSVSVTGRSLSAICRDRVAFPRRSSESRPPSTSRHARCQSNAFRRRVRLKDDGRDRAAATTSASSPRRPPPGRLRDFIVKFNITRQIISKTRRAL